ncbi:hypothetical protein [Actinokineospora sp.]|uniref:hypothetical protein n=1 Tax=Actinokineospora sp. TaxID=1872133 RepID=UPI003D6B1F64
MLVLDPAAVNAAIGAWLLAPLAGVAADLSTVAVTADAPHCQRGHADYLHEVGAQFCFPGQTQSTQLLHRARRAVLGRHPRSPTARLIADRTGPPPALGRASGASNPRTAFRDTVYREDHSPARTGPHVMAALRHLAGSCGVSSAPGFARVPGIAGRQRIEASDSPLWAEHITFSEYFDGDTREGLGASHQTGCSALVGVLIAGWPNGAGRVDFFRC